MTLQQQKLPAAFTVQSLPIGALFFPLLTLVVTVAISIFVALQNRERDPDVFWKLATQEVALQGLEEFRFWCRQDRDSRSLYQFLRADTLACRWPESKQRLKILGDLLDQGKDRVKVNHELDEFASQLSGFSDQPDYRDIRRKLDEIVRAIDSVEREFVTNNPRWSESDPLENTLNDLVKYINIGRVAKLECLYRLTGIPVLDSESFAAHILTTWRWKIDLLPCRIGFGAVEDSLNSIRYNLGKAGTGKIKFGFGETPLLMAAARMLPMHLDGKLVMDYTLSDLVGKRDETRKELQERARFIAGADLISPTAPIPDLPYILVLWIFLLLVPCYYLSANFALWTIRLRSSDMEDRRWVALALLPQTRWLSILNHTAIVGPFILLASMIFCFPAFIFTGEKIGLSSGISFDFYEFVVSDQSPLVRAANKYFWNAYVVAFVGAVVLACLTYIGRRRCILAQRAAPVSERTEVLEQNPTSELPPQSEDAT